MNKAELIEVVAARIDASKKDAGEAVQAVVDAITEAVAKGQKVSISGFGVFERAARPPRTYRTPSTGEAIQKLATSVPKFRPGGDFRAFVSGDKNISELTKRAEGVLRRVTGQGGKPEEESAAAPTEAPAAAPAKKAPAKRATSTAKKTTAAKKTTTAKKATTAKATTARKTTAKAAASGDAPAKRTTTRKATTTAKKAPAKRAPRKTAAPAAEAAAETDSQ